MRKEQAARAGAAVARAVAAGEPYVAFLLHEVSALVGTDAGGGLVRSDPAAGDELIVTEMQGPWFTVDELRAAAQAVPLHPSFAPGRPRTHRVSDRVGSMRDFWASDMFAVMHRPLGGRFPLSVPFALEHPSLVHVGLMRESSDFSDGDVETLEIFARPIRAALAFRVALDEAVGRLPAEPDADVRFTSREVEVMMLVAAGWTDGHIARRLGISEATVRQRLTTARDRVGAVNRTHLVVRWLEITGQVHNVIPRRAPVADEG